MAKTDAQLEQQVREKCDKIYRLTEEIHKVIVGQDKMITRLLVGLLANGHVLLEGVPGLAKTLVVRVLAEALSLKFQRIQFTPDLLPADLIGTLIYNPREGAFEVKKGPIFANVVLADEINRSPAKVQSALLEAMQEKQVTIGSETFKLDRPFLVLATQNPIDQEGTYPLPEAQVDRFMLKIFVDYPTKEEELKILRLMARTEHTTQVQPALNQEELLSARKLIDRIELSQRLEQYIVDIVIATRKPAEYNLGRLASYIEYGASPRATIALSLGAKALAMMRGRTFVLPQDIKELAPDVLNHRIMLSYEAEAEGVTTYSCVDEILGAVPI